MASKSRLDLKAAYEATKKKSSLDELKITAGIPLNEDVETSSKAEKASSEKEEGENASSKNTSEKAQTEKQKEEPKEDATAKPARSEKKLGRPFADERSMGKTEKITVLITEQEAKAIRDYCYQNNVVKVTVVRDALDEFFQSRGYY